jgi:hypothetical protein
MRAELFPPSDRQEDMTASRHIRVAATMVAITAMLGLSSCHAVRSEETTADDAHVQMMTAVEAVQTSTGAEWTVDLEPGMIGCSRTHGQWVTSWHGVPTEIREASFEAVRASLETPGYETFVNGERTDTPVLVAETERGFSLGFSMPFEGEIGLSASSDCFLETNG